MKRARLEGSCHKSFLLTLNAFKEMEAKTNELSPTVYYFGRADFATICLNGGDVFLK